MTGPQHADLASDLAYVRSLAEEGAHAPLVGGRYYVIWGGLMGAASAIAYLTTMDILPLGAAGMIAPWIVAGVIGWALSFAFARQSGAKPGAATIGNRTAGSVWRAVGVFITLFWAAMMFVHGQYTEYGVPRYFLFGLMFPVGFGVYGVAFFATATAARVAWLRYFAVLSWAFMMAAMFLLESPHQFLLGAVGMIACAVAPGVLLMRREPAEIV